jgi:hypothetical protein
MSQYDRAVWSRRYIFQARTERKAAEANAELEKVHEKHLAAAVRYDHHLKDGAPAV